MKLYAVILITMVTGFIASCNDGVELPEITGQYPIVEVARPLAVKDTIRNESGRFEMGYEFIPKVDGQFQSITGVLPATTAYKITLWDAFSKEVIRSWEIEYFSNLYQEFFIDDPIDLTAGKSYMLTINTIYWYEYEPPATGTIFPQTIENVEIVRFGKKEAFQTEYPTEFYDNEMWGLIDFRFEPYLTD